MRVIPLILAAYAFAGWNDAQAACQKFSPDGTIDVCQHMAPGGPLPTPAPEQASASLEPSWPIALRLQPTGMRKPWDGAVYEAAREFIVKECNK